MSDATPDRVLHFPVAWDGMRERANATTAVQPAGFDNSFLADEELLIQLKESDERALGFLIDRYLRMVKAAAYRILRDRGETEEIVQDVFLYLFRRSDLFDPSRGTARTWIMQVAYSRALDRREYLIRRRFYAGTDSHSMPDKLVGDTDLEREVISKLIRTRLRTAFLELPDKQREVLELFYFEGLSLREISERLEEPIGNTRHHYYRGIEQLRKSAMVQQLRSKQL